MTFFRKLFKWLPREGKAPGTANPESASAPAATPGAPAAPPVPASPSPAQESSEPSPLPEDCIALPLKAITDLLPPELKPALRKQPSEHVQVHIPRGLIQPQLATGAVRITFSELRGTIPEIFFQPDAIPADARLLLPLEAILRRMMPGRREDQRQPAIPVSIPSIFAKAGAGPARPGAPAARGSAEPWYSQRRPTYAEPAAGAGAPAAPEKARTAKPSPGAQSPSNGEIRRAPNAEGERENGQAKRSTPQHQEHVASQPPPPAIAPTSAESSPAPSAPAPSASITQNPIITSNATPIATAPPVPAPPAPVSSAPPVSVTIPFTAVLPVLPPEVRRGLNGETPVDGTLVVPLAEIENRIRSGKLRFKWSQLEGWCIPARSASLAEDTEVDLPLPAVVPLFLAARRPPDQRKKVEVDSRIPNVFGKSSAPAPAAPQAATPATSGATAPVAAPAPEPPASPTPPPASAQTPVPASVPAPVDASAPPLRLEKPASPPTPPSDTPEPTGNADQASVAQTTDAVATITPTVPQSEVCDPQLAQAPAPAPAPPVQETSAPDAISPTMEMANASPIANQISTAQTTETVPAVLPFDPQSEIRNPQSIPASQGQEMAAPPPATQGQLPFPPSSMPGQGSDPSEIVRRIRAIDGVAGAFLATSDGLLVSGDVPDANDSVLAAFAPTVFTQISKYSGMARLGVPEGVELHLSGGIIHVRKTGKLYLGVLMPHGRPVPLSELDCISTALQPHTP